MKDAENMEALLRAAIELYEALPRCPRCARLATAGITSHEPTHCEDHYREEVGGYRSRSPDWAEPAVELAAVLKRLGYS